MASQVLSTNKILLQKVFNLDIGEDWISWAIEMIEAGHESESLYILAGTTKPYNQFELQDLTSKVLKELKLNYSNKDDVIRNYIYSLISNAITTPAIYLNVLRELRDIYCALDMDGNYSDFYLLYFAKEDLNESENQWYWDGATKETIDEIIRTTFANWMVNFETDKRHLEQ